MWSLVGLLSVLFGACNCALDWGYSLENGPNTWIQKYDQCYGQRQSPIVLPNVWRNDTFLRRLGFYNFEHKRELTVQNDGRILVLDYKRDGQANPYVAGSMYPPGQHFEMYRIEIHYGSDSTRGSEHIMEGKNYPGEMQLYFFDKKYGSQEEAAKNPGGLTVAVFMLDVQKEHNPNLDVLLRNLYKVNGTTTPAVFGNINFEFMYPVESDIIHDCEYYVYEGSLTSPPCSEVVIWHIYRDATSMSEKQWEHIRSLVAPLTKKRMVNNNRHIQALNNRQVWQHRELPPTDKDVVELPKNKKMTVDYAYPAPAYPSPVYPAEPPTSGGLYPTRDAKGFLKYGMQHQQHALFEDVDVASEYSHLEHVLEYPEHLAFLPPNPSNAAQGLYPSLPPPYGPAAPAAKDTIEYSYLKPYVGDYPPADPTAGGYGK